MYDRNAKRRHWLQAGGILVIILMARFVYVAETQVFRAKSIVTVAQHQIMDDSREAGNDIPNAELVVKHVHPDWATDFDNHVNQLNTAKNKLTFTADIDQRNMLLNQEINNIRGVQQEMSASVQGDPTSVQGGFARITDNSMRNHVTILDDDVATLNESLTKYNHEIGKNIEVQAVANMLGEKPYNHFLSDENVLNQILRNKFSEVV